MMILVCLKNTSNTYMYCIYISIYMKSPHRTPSLNQHTQYHKIFTNGFQIFWSLIQLLDTILDRLLVVTKQGTHTYSSSDDCVESSNEVVDYWIYLGTYVSTYLLKIIKL